MRTESIVAAMAVAFMLMTACSDGEGYADHTGSEFVCYSDGVLVERHVGVRDAFRRDAGLWRLTYVDSDEWKQYRQAGGETCGVESY